MKKLSPKEIINRSRSRECRWCKKIQNPSQFWKTTSHKCKKCYAATGNRWAKNNPEKVKAACKRSILKKKYGLSMDDYISMVIDQKNRCAICEKEPDGRWKTFHIDHDHKSGKVRGLTCYKCNALLGMALDDVFILHAAIRYLQRGKTRRDHGNKL